MKKYVHIIVIKETKVPNRKVFAKFTNGGKGSIWKEETEIGEATTFETEIEALKRAEESGLKYNSLKLVNQEYLDLYNLRRDIKEKIKASFILKKDFVEYGLYDNLPDDLKDWIDDTFPDKKVIQFTDKEDPIVGNKYRVIFDSSI